MLVDTAASDDRWRFLSLRYFNPVGAHASGRIGEDPEGIPNNLMPYIMQVATGRHPFVRVFGDDYPTPDGTGVRDYIHVVDLALGHLAALDALGGLTGFTAVNLGTGTGSSVLEVIAAASRAIGREVPHKRRRAPSGRHRRHVGRPLPRPRAARVEGHPHPRRHGRRPLALAVAEPAGLRGARRLTPIVTVI